MIHSSRVICINATAARLQLKQRRGHRHGHGHRIIFDIISQGKLSPIQTSRFIMGSDFLFNTSSVSQAVNSLRRNPPIARSQKQKMAPVNRTIVLSLLGLMIYISRLAADTASYIQKFRLPYNGQGRRSSKLRNCFRSQNQRILELCQAVLESPSQGFRPEAYSTNQVVILAKGTNKLGIK